MLRGNIESFALGIQSMRYLLSWVISYLELCSHSSRIISCNVTWWLNVDTTHAYEAPDLEPENLQCNCGCTLEI